MRDITVHKCDTCDRSVQLPRNSTGIETVGHCIITENCRGRLFVDDLILTISPFISRTPDVAGLTNFHPRSKLSKYTQSFDKNVWNITHNLNTFPIVAVYSDDEAQTPISDLDYKIEIINSNTVNLIFNVAVSGTAELYVRELSPNSEPTIQRTVVEEFVPVSTNLITGTFTVALTNKTFTKLSNEDNEGIARIRIKFTDANNQNRFGNFVLSPTNINTPWNGIDSVVFKNRSYSLYTVNIFTDGYNTSLVSSGTIVTILKPDSTMFQKNQAIILLAQAPFERVDITLNQVIEIDKIDSINSILFFDNDEIVCNNNAITNTFPNLMLD